MAPSGLGSAGNIGGRGVAKGESRFGLLLLQAKYSNRVTEREMEREGDQSMSRNSPVSMEDSRDGCHCSRCGGRSVGGLSKEHAFSTPLTGGANDLGEAWFRNENSTVERKSLMRLERELEAALSFEHGDGEDGGPRVHPIWITRIFLGCLFRERQALGKAVKLYARFQHREFMRSLVKINDLEDQAEAPLRGLVDASSSANYKKTVISRCFGTTSTKTPQLYQNSILVPKLYTRYLSEINKHKLKDEDGAEINKHREVCLYFEEDVSYSNDESLDSTIVDIEEDKSLQSTSMKNINDGISQNIQAALRNFEIAKMQKHDLGSRKYVIMHGATKTQIKETDLLQPYCSVDCHTMCLQDQLSAGQMTGSNNMNLMSKLKEVKGITHCEGRGNIQHQAASVDFASQQIPGKDALEHKVELSPECIASGELTSKESLLQVEVVNSITLWRDCFHLRSCGNDLMKSSSWCRLHRTNWDQ